MSNDPSHAIGQVPTALTPLIGRENEITQIRKMLCESGIRLITLTGQGGVGKTRLAQAVAQAAEGYFRGCNALRIGHLMAVVGGGVAFGRFGINGPVVVVPDKGPDSR